MGRTVHTMTTTAKAVNQMGALKDSEAAVNSFADSAEKAGNKTQKASKEVSLLATVGKSAPDSFGKSAAALNLLGTATSQMSGKVADGANKIAALASLVMTGGAFGIAIAGVTAAVGAAAFVWDKVNAASAAAEKTAQAMGDALKRTTVAVKSQRQEVESLNDAFENWGETQSATTIRHLDEEVSAIRARNKADVGTIVQLERKAKIREQEADAMVAGKYGSDAMVDGLREEAAALRQSAAEMSRFLQAQDAKLTGLEEELNTRREMARRTEEETEAEKKKEEAKKRHHEQERGRDKEREAWERLAEQKRAERRAALKVSWEQERKDEAEHLRQRQSMVDEFVAARDEQRRRELTAQEAMLQRSIEAEKEATRAKMALVAQTGAAFSAMISQYVADSMRGEDAASNFAKGALSLVLSTVKQQIMAYAAAAAARGMESGIEQAGMPYGLVIGAAFAAAALSAVEGYVQSLASGGFVQGGERGKDSVPAMLMPGEYVMSTPEVAGLKKLFVRMGSPEMASMMSKEPPRRERAGQVVINNGIWYPDTVAKMRMTRDQAGSVRKLQRRRMY